MSTAATTATTTAAAATSTTALAKLAGNFNDFLSLLTTQLKNQDPTSPLDTSQFTTELVQFTGVEQQINTNASLTALIQATQGAEVIQATSIVGKPVVVTSTQLALQNGASSINFNTAQAQPVEIRVTNASGTVIKDASLTSASGANTWRWDGTTDNGVQMADGAYTVTVMGASSSGNTTAVPFTVNGTATGVTNTDGVVSLNLGGLAVDFSAVTSVGP